MKRTPPLHAQGCPDGCRRKAHWLLLPSRNSLFRTSAWNVGLCTCLDGEFYLERNNWHSDPIDLVPTEKGLETGKIFT